MRASATHAPTSHTCKERHVRCDEKKPICGNCERLDLRCKASELFTADSSWRPRDEQASGPRENGSSPTSAAWPATASGRPASTQELYNSSSPVIQTLCEPVQAQPTSPSAHASHPARHPHSFCASPTSQHPTTPHPIPNPSTSTTTTTTPTPPPAPPLLPLPPETVHLLHAYRAGLARTMDLFDLSRTYSRAVPRRALSSPLLLRSICALAARHLSRLPALRGRCPAPAWDPRAAAHYGDALALLIARIVRSEHPDAGADASTPTGDAGAAAHRQHFAGAHVLVRTRGIGPRSPAAVDRASFWVYVRHDIVVALRNESGLLLGPAEWGVGRRWRWRGWDAREDEMAEDERANWLMWLVARATDWTYAGGTGAEREELLRDVEAWFDGLPLDFKGVRYGEVTEEGFSRLYFALPACASAMMWYHTLYILLYGEPNLRDPAYSSRIQEHAVEIVNINVSELPEPVRIFAAVPLYYGQCSCQHARRVKKETRVWALLEDVEKQHGYCTRNEVKKLQDLVESTC
ncbi:hypothetical protein BDY21DRAFT_403078 [Lineolata rhizophorae]|uniref:Zn(2)-C6 fungal-type domain-containing protein n=1 Tax=Lineolata rhizophorae TaxID=578093 RepID=A0A6A6PAG8_9PEZI|nr:hypothetical protein BDY21DRAFT_403078 [Lineolata rhizophorae]